MTKMLKRRSPKTTKPDWKRPVEIRYTVGFDIETWRKVHPPHLAAAVAAGEAAIRAHLEAVSPYPYSVAEVKTHAAYSNVLWSTTEPDDGGLEE